ncbi:MAG: Gldg family protein [Planctomycetota bacterium]
MALQTHVIRAVFKRNVLSYFASPTGYVFITIFVFLGAFASFWQDRFFAQNLANLNTLNAVFPYLLLFFIPAVTMSLWAEERRQGTDELLFTLPAHDYEVVLGKYLAAVAIYTVALLFSLSNVIALSMLGEPDIGLMVSTYFGYWLFGSALIGVGMVGSLMASNVTIGFIVGAVLCAAVVFIHRAGTILGDALNELVGRYSAVPLFEQFASGVLSITGLFYFVGLATFAFVLNVALLRRRHRGGQSVLADRGIHDFVRVVAVFVAFMSLTVVAGRFDFRPDLTAEGLHSLSSETEELIDNIDPERPVYIQAFFSPEVPQAYTAKRQNLVNLLRQYDQMGGDRVVVKIHETERFSDAARQAQEKFNIRPMPVYTSEGGRGKQDEIYLGMVFTSGLEEVIIPFFDRGLSEEYELTRSIGVVSRTARKRLGVLATDADVLGGFDFQSMRQSPEWSVVGELKKQYEVERVDPAADYPADLDVLLAILPSSLNQEQMDRFQDYIEAGNPTLIFDDPLPLGARGELLAMAPSEPKPREQQQNPFGGGGPPPEPKGDIMGMLQGLGLSWSIRDIVWDSYNPHPELQNLPPEFVFIGTNSGADMPFNQDHPVTSGLQEIVQIYPGRVQSANTSGVTFTPLLTTGLESGRIGYQDVVTRSFFGTQLNDRVPHIFDPRDYILAAQVKGSIGEGGERSVNLIFCADIDMISEQFFALRRQGVEGLEFDNVTFVLNAVDVLSGDESFVALRKQRRQHRTLSELEKEIRVHEEARLEKQEKAENEAQAALARAQQQLESAVQQIEERTDLDDRAKAIQIETVRATEQRKLDVSKSIIEDEKEQEIELSQIDMEREILDIQSRIRLLAVALPPIPALLLGIIVFVVRRGREKRTISEARQARR